MKKRILITGGAGFIAHHIIRHFLKNTDWEIVSLDRLDYSGNLNRIADMMNEFDKETQKRLRIIFHDLRAEINQMLTADLGEFEYILHLAASSHVDRSIDNPMEFVLDNVVATCNILNYAKQQNKLERFIYFGTDEVFGPAPLGVNYKERDRYNSTNPYSATKAAVNTLTRTLSKEVGKYNIKVNTMSPGPCKTEMFPENKLSTKLSLPTIEYLATLPKSGPTGEFFWFMKKINIFSNLNNINWGKPPTKKV